MTSSHGAAHYVEHPGRHTNLRGLCHVRNMMGRGFEGLRRMTLRTADLLETGSDIVLSGRFA